MDLKEEEIAMITAFIDNARSPELSDNNHFNLQFVFWDERELDTVFTKKEWENFKETKVYPLCQHITFQMQKSNDFLFDETVVVAFNSLEELRQLKIFKNTDEETAKAKKYYQECREKYDNSIMMPVETLGKSFLKGYYNKNVEK